MCSRDFLLFSGNVGLSYVSTTAGTTVVVITAFEDWIMKDEYPIDTPGAHVSVPRMTDEEIGDGVVAAKCCGHEGM